MKNNVVKKYLKFGVLLFGICLLIITCKKEESLNEITKTANFKTVPINEALAFLSKTKAAASSSKNSFITTFSESINYQ